jgi:hypothetical protein
VGFTKPATESCSFSEGEITNPKKFSILLSCWHMERTQILVLVPMAQLLLITLKTNGGN